jgi:hypothetical protein
MATLRPFTFAEKRERASERKNAGKIRKNALDDLIAVADMPRDELAQAMTSLAVATLAFNDLAMLCAAGLERLERAKVRVVK